MLMLDKLSKWEIYVYYIVWVGLFFMQLAAISYLYYKPSLADGLTEDAFLQEILKKIKNAFIIGARL